MREEQKHRQKKGRQGLPLTAAFLGFLAVFGAGLVFLPEKVFSDTENRYLAQKPEWTPEAFLDGSYGEDYEKYLSDQFPMRGGLVALKALAQRSAGKRDVNGVYFGKDGYFIERFDREKLLNGQLQKNIAYLAKAVSSFEESLGEDHVRVMLVPSASQILTEKLPDFAEPWDQTEVYELLREAAWRENAAGKGKRGEAQDWPSWLLRPDQVLAGHSGEELYYRTDHHWTTKGAYYAFSCWMDSIGEKAPDMEKYDRTVVTEEFLGTIHSKLNIPMNPDRIEVWTPAGAGEWNGDSQFEVFYDGVPEAHGSLYEPERLKGRDKYAVFLDGNHALTEIVNTEAAGHRRLLIIKDSYAHCFAAFAAPYFERVYMADLRYLNQKLSELAEEEKVTDVLVLYQIPGFASDENVTKIAR